MHRFITYDYSRADWNGLRNHLRDVPGKISLNSVLLLLLVNFMSGFRLELIVLYLKYQVKPHTHLHGFQLLALLPLLRRNHFFCLCQQSKSSQTKVKFRQASNRCKKVLEAAELAYANKIKEPPHFPEIWLLGL